MLIIPDKMYVPINKKPDFYPGYELHYTINIQM